MTSPKMPSFVEPDPALVTAEAVANEVFRLTRGLNDVCQRAAACSVRVELEVDTAAIYVGNHGERTPRLSITARVFREVAASDKELPNRGMPPMDPHPWIIPEPGRPNAG